MGALDAGFWFEGVCIPAIACIGFIGNIAMLVKYVKMKRKRLMDNLLLTICCFDIATLFLMCYLFSFNHFDFMDGISHREVALFLKPYALFLVGVSIYGSMFGTLCLSLERYFLVTNLGIHRRLTVLNLVVPVVMYSVMANAPKLFLLSSTCFDMFEGLDNESLFCEKGQLLQVSVPEIRRNVYFSIAFLLFASFNIIIPFVAVMVLNILNYRHIKRMLISWVSTPSNSESLQKKHDLDLCLRTVYAVLLFGICHGTRIIPNLYEIKTRFTLEDWTGWITAFVPITHMLVVVASSLNFFAYYGVYGQALKANTVRYDETELCLQNMTTVIEYDV